jgi:DNA processing protein
MEARNLLLYLSIKYRGNWDKIYEAIKRKEDVKEDDVNLARQETKSKYITIIDSDYPKVLSQIFKPPFVIFYYGDIKNVDDIYKCISVVGSRHSSDYGVAMTRNIVSKLAETKTIISGMASGIDSVAHEAAIHCGGKTVAILGGGIDYCYPKENKKLYEEIKNNHLLLSEYPGNLEPEKEQFPFRNRLIAAFSEATLVTEANSQKSGTLVTVRYALMFGRDVMCVPYCASSGSVCNRLIKEGACLVENATDILQELKKPISETHIEKNIS